MLTTKPTQPPLSILENSSSGAHPAYMPSYLRNIMRETNTPAIATKLEDPRAAPLRAHPTDAGGDLFSNAEVHIYPGEQKLIDTGVAVKIPVGFVGYIFNRSSQGKIGIQIANGTGIIDSAYRGNLKVLLKNNGEDPYFIYAYTTRIAQLVISPIVLATFVPWVGTDEDWLDTERGTGGFGSTGG